MSLKYNTDPMFKSKVDSLEWWGNFAVDELAREKGWTFEDNDGSLADAGNQWNTMGLWSVGMTASKTEAVNERLMKVAQ
jgi:hypothetical protein